MTEAYTAALCKAIAAYKVRLCSCADTLYIGGGTPTVLTPEQLCRIIGTARDCFGNMEEITLEANPADDLADTFAAVAKAGVNRLSLGVQSAVDTELAALGRRHTNTDVEKTVKAARAAGIQNISLDIMLGLPYQTRASLDTTIEFCLAQRPTHISAYMLKIEPGTPLGQIPVEQLHLPGEDTVAELYLHTVNRLEQAGLQQYEISNFALPGKESCHNLKYWLGQDYLGLGPAAHSCIGGKRFYFPRDSKAFIAGTEPVADTSEPGAEEYIMLRLRLRQGIRFADYKARFGVDLRQKKASVLQQLAKAGLATVTDTHFCLTPAGFLVSNAIILKIAE